jgi:hypothetical protein
VAQVVHCESAAVVQVRDDVHPTIEVHAAHVSATPSTR